MGLYRSFASLRPSSSVLNDVVSLSFLAKLVDLSLRLAIF